MHVYTVAGSFRGKSWWISSQTLQSNNDSRIFKCFFDFTQFKQNHPKKEKNNQKTDRRKYQHYFIFHKLAHGFTAIFNTQTNSNFLDRSFKYQIFVTPVFQSMISVSKLHSKRIIINTIIQEGTFYHRETK